MVSTQIKTQSKQNLQLLPKINIDKLASICNRATDVQRDPNAGGQLAIVIIPSFNFRSPLSGDYQNSKGI